MGTIMFKNIKFGVSIFVKNNKLDNLEFLMI